MPDSIIKPKTSGEEKSEQAPHKSVGILKLLSGSKPAGPKIFTRTRLSTKGSSLTDLIAKFYKTDLAAICSACAVLLMAPIAERFIHPPSEAYMQRGFSSKEGGYESSGPLRAIGGRKIPSRPGPVGDYQWFLGWASLPDGGGDGRQWKVRFEGSHRTHQ